MSRNYYTTIKERGVRAKAIVIAANIPEFADKDQDWFRTNEAKIRSLARRELWWKNRIIVLETGNTVNPLELSRRLTDSGYNRRSVIETVAGSSVQPERGEFSFSGGVIRITPINSNWLSEIEFLGNTIETIRSLPIETVPPPRKRSENDELSVRFKPGDFVVHADHGIGIFKGETTDLDQYWEIHYAHGDRLFVPFSQTKKLSLYIGFNRPRIMRLGGTLWTKITSRAHEDILAFARELLAHYKDREKEVGYKFDPVPEMESLIASFPHPETPDQVTAWRDIERDMENSQPMDRLVVGDVGFGKTELAVRAAFKAAMNGKQVAVLAPTTILAWQHEKTFAERLERFGIRIAPLSRLQNTRDQREIVDAIKNGKCDVVIGTHRLLSKDIKFKNLGLLIVDEEQRFGVKHKEKLIMLERGIDVLSLSATPIPRTLSAALSGIKKISRLETPPLGRESISTVVEQFSWKRVREAAKSELARQGQIFFLENRIGRFDLRRREITREIPEARLAFLHGRMSEKAIVETLERFRNGTVDILVATTIIENGLDLPNANTLIVADGSKLGLAEAHQIRGRIGRSATAAYAYFFYPQHVLDATARQRLDALLRYSSLGEGFQIALEDLKIRGAGTILGKRQSGHVQNIGFHLYLDMLNEALSELS